MSMKQKLLLLMGGMMLTAFSLPLAAQSISWTDDSQKPDTLWYTEHKEGTEYTLTKPEELAGLSVLVNTYQYTFEGKTIKLGNDVSLAKTVGEETVLWTPVGLYIKGHKIDIPFKGTFDGQGHTVDGMQVSGTIEAVGLFGNLSGATVRNLVIGSNSSVTSTNSSAQIGSVAGLLTKSRILNCTNHMPVSSPGGTNVYVGGIIGRMNVSGYIGGCKNYGEVSNPGSVGGITASTNKADTVVNCVNYGKVTGKDADNSYTGGIVGYLYEDSRVLNNANYGSVIRGGGIVGKAVAGSYYAGIRGRLNNNLNMGEVSLDDKKGYSIVASASYTLISRNYSKDNGGKSGENGVAFTVLTDEQLKSEALLKELTASAGYENALSGGVLGATAWKLGEEGYPVPDADVAANAYRVNVAVSLMGELVTHPLATDDAQAFYHTPGTQVTLDVKAFAGYTFSGLKLNGEISEGNTFTMPERDVEVTLLFDSGEALTWADMAQYAEAGADYKLEGENYEIYTAKGLAYATSKVNAGEGSENTFIRLGSDINLGVPNAAGDTLLWMPMGTDDHPFNGIFDGADYTVDYMHINATAEKYAGLVGKADGAEIKNIKIGENSRISSAQTYLGAVAGAVSNTLVTNCHNAANLTSTAMYVGGVLGDATGAKTVISMCSNTGTVTTTANMAGGITARLGDNNAVCVLYNCFNTGAISAKGTAGGIVAFLQTPTAGTGKSLVANCYNTGDVTADENTAGGIVGQINMFSEIKNCVSSAKVSAVKRYAGGIVGNNNNKNNPGPITRCYYLENTVTSGSDMNTSGNALTAEQMYGSALVTEMSNFAGYLNNKELTSYLQWVKVANSCPNFDAKNTVAASAYILSVKEPEHGKYELVKPVAVLAQDSTTIFVKKNTAVEFATTPDEGYVFYALRVNGDLQTEYVNNFRTATGDVEVEVLFSLPRRWDQVASEAVAGTDYAETETGYEIHTPLGLAYITDKVNNGGDMMAGKQVALTADIDLTRENADGIAFTWLPIGSSSKNFKGAFDGRGHSVKNMLVNAGTGYGGLFGYVSGDTIANVTISGKSSVTGTNYLGAIAGYLNSKAVVLNCNNDSCRITTSSTYAGGLVGNAGSGCKVINSSSTGSVSGTDKVGGIVGYIQGEVIACLSTGKVVSGAKGGAILGDGYNPVVTRSYRQEGIVEAANENVSGTALEIADIQSQALADEMTAYAGYLNRTTGSDLAGWTYTEEHSPVSSSVKAGDAYKVSVSTEMVNGTLALPVLLTQDEEAEFYAVAGNPVKLTITPDEGYQLDVLTVNEEPATLTDDSFVMPATDVMLAATFKTGGVGIEKDEADFIRMWTSNATLYVVLPQQTSVMIAGTDGRILINELAEAGTVSYPLERGLYILKIGDASYKVAVK